MTLFSGQYRLPAFCLLMLFTIVQPVHADDECRMAVSQPSIQYGKIVWGDVVKNLQGNFRLSEKEIQVSIVCPSPRRVGVFFTGDADSRGEFRFTARSNVLIAVTNMMVDGQTRQIVKMRTPGQLALSGAPVSAVSLLNQEGVAPVEHDTVIAGQNISFVVRVQPNMEQSDFRVSSPEQVAAQISLRLETRE